MADNRIFNVNGKGLEHLKQTLALACALDSYQNRNRIDSWFFSKNHGLVFCWGKPANSSHFPTAISAEQAADMAWQWLQTDEAKKMECTGWDRDADHDGSNSLGWRVFVEDWGHVAGSFYAIAAVRPAFMWHGK
jgi:hypothetical protein